MSFFSRKFFSTATDNMNIVLRLFQKLSGNSHLISTMFTIRSTQLQNLCWLYHLLSFSNLFCRTNYLGSYLVYILFMWGEEIAQPNQYGNAKNQSTLLHFMESFFFFVCGPNLHCKLQLSFYHCHLIKVAKNIGICFEKKSG